MKVGDLVVHIGALRNIENQGRLRIVCGFRKKRVVNDMNDIVHLPRELIVFENGMSDWKDQWTVYKGEEHVEKR